MGTWGNGPRVLLTRTGFSGGGRHTWREGGGVSRTISITYFIRSDRMTEFWAVD